MCMFYRSLFVSLSFFFWPLCCVFFFDLRILITPFGIFKLCICGERVGSIKNKQKYKQLHIVFTIKLIEEEN